MRHKLAPIIFSLTASIFSACEQTKPQVPLLSQQTPEAVCQIREQKLKQLAQTTEIINFTVDQNQDHNIVKNQPCKIQSDPKGKNQNQIRIVCPNKFEGQNIYLISTGIQRQIKTANTTMSPTNQIRITEGPEAKQLTFSLHTMNYWKEIKDFETECGYTDPLTP